MNIGICYEELKDYDNAANHLDVSINIFEKSERISLTKALFAMAHVEAKRNKFNVAQEYYLQGKELE